MVRYRGYFFHRLMVTAAAVAAPLLALNAFNLWTQREADISTATAVVQARADRVAREADAVIARAERVLDFLASREEFQNPRENHCDSLLRGITAVDTLLANVGAVDLKGQPLCRAVVTKGAYANYAQVPWFKAAVAHNGTFFSAPYVGEISKRRLVNVVHPVLDVDGRRIGLLAAALDVEALARMVLTMEGMPAGSVVSVIGSDGTLVFADNNRMARVGTQVSAQVHGQLSNPAGESFVATGVDKIERVIATSSMQHFGLRAAAGEPTSAVMAASSVRFARSIFTAAAVGVVALALALGGARRLNRPVSSLVRSARNFGNGEQDARADEALPGEFKELAVEFNRAIDAHRSSAKAHRAQTIAEASSQMKSQFLANMSHEIRTPMNAIIGLTDLAMRNELSPKVHGYLSKVKVAATSLLGIINEILDFSKVEAGKLVLEATEFGIQDVLDRVTSVVGLPANEKGLELLMSTSAELPELIIGDPLRLEQILVNLCSNAVKFTDKGAIILLTVKAVDVSRGSTTLRFSVRDTGRGMTEEQVRSLFQPFNQLDPSTTRTHGGTGLGLAICKQLVNLMGGEIGCRSQLGKWTEFSFTANFKTAGAGGEQFKGRYLWSFSALVVDDNENARDIFKELLSDFGAEVTTAVDGREADAMMQVATFDVLLLDWKLPDIDGLELARRARTYLPESKALLTTAYGNEAAMHLQAAEGVHACLFKPVSREAMRNALVGVLGLSAAAAQTGHPAPKANPKVIEAPSNLRGRHVLLVEDNEFNQIVATELLSTVAGVRVSLAKSGTEAIELVREQTYDAVLMDIQMPDMDGYQATAYLRSESKNESLPIIAMTAYALIRDRDKCLAAGMNDYIAKPFEPAELFAVLSRWIESSERIAQWDVRDVTNDGKPPRGVDFEQGLRSCLGRAEIYDLIIRRFLQTRTNDGNELRAAFEAGNFKRIHMLAHTLTSTASTLGAIRLSLMCHDLQVAADDAVDWFADQALVMSVADEQELVVAELGDYINRREIEPPTAGEV